MSETMENKNGRKKIRAFLIAGSVVAVGLVALFLYQGYARSHLKTDDAFVKGSIHLVAPRVAGTVSEVLVRDNQAVKAGEPLVKLDPVPFEQGLAEAQASLRAEQGKLVEVKAQVEAQEKRVAATRAALESTRQMGDQLAAAVSARDAELKAREASIRQAQLDLERAGKLAGQEVIPQSKLDRAKTALEIESAGYKAAVERKKQAEAALRAHTGSVAQVRAQLKAEEASLEKVRASLGTQNEQIARRQAQLKIAELRLGYSDVKAPVDGFVTRMSAEVGNTVQTGQPLMSLVSLEDAYVLANYKETRIKHIQPGQKAKIKIDAYPGRKFSGTVDSIMAGAGSAFTLFPTENASGNYVKVVQRIPVKIIFDNIVEARPYLKVGISVVPTILTKQSSK